MKKRLASLLLAVVISISVVAVGAVPAAAEGELKASEACIARLKEEEGFSRVPYWDYAQYTVGYGTRCPDEMLDYYMANGITEAEAEALMYTYLNAFEEALRTQLIDKYQLTLNQYQFDALIMFSYNCGSGWLYKQQDNLRDAIVRGATGNELIDLFARWCNAGGQILKPLLRRRLSEANLYLNGVYAKEPPENYAYVLYDAAGGVCSPNVQGYDTAVTAQITTTPTYEGYQFEGWYTERIGGTQVTVLDASTKNARLYAHWTDAEGKDPAEVGDAEGTKVTIATDELNVRKGPGTNYDSVGKLNTGDEVVITETAANGSYTWGKFYGGWIRLDYTDYQAPAVDEDQTPEASDPVTGTVKVSDALRIRSGPSTAYSVVGTLSNGTKVEILEQKIVGHMTWGKISNGWISLDYVVLDPKAEPEETTPPTTEPEATTPPTTAPEETTPSTTAPEETTPSEETTPPTTEPEQTEPPVTEPEATEPPATEPEATEPPATEPEPTVLTGTVKVNDFLRIRSGPGTSYSIAGYLSPNETVQILEQQTVGSTKWGKISSGWISLDYVVLNDSGSSDNSGSNSTGNDSAAQQTLTGTVQVNDFLRIRSGPSTSYAIAGYLSPNETVEILEQKTVGSTKWGRISKGWVSMDYIQLKEESSTEQSGTPELEQTQTATKTVIADCLRIRSAAGTGNTIVGYLYTGAKVEVLETTTVDGTAWGRISKGWISLDYVK